MSFRQYNPNKPAKFGLLYKSVNATRYPYTFIMHPYAGKPKEEPTEHYVTGTEPIVRYLMEGMLEHMNLQGRNVSMDRLYTSITLAEWLFSKRITMVGTMMANRKGIPPAFKSTEGRSEFSYKVLWNTAEKNMSLHSYVVRTKSTGPRNVLLLTTMKPILGVTKDDGKKKPAICKLYDYTKGGTDIVDQRAQTYTCKVKSNKWTLVALSFVLDTCRINASTILAMNDNKDPRKVNSLNFGWQLSEALVMPFIQQRPLQGLAISTQRKMEIILGMSLHAPPAAVAELHHDAKSDTPRRCRHCIQVSHGQGHKNVKENMAKCRSQCQHCGEAVCPKHSVLSCITCQ